MPVRGVLFDLDDTLFDHDHATSCALAGLHAAVPAFAGWTADDLTRRHSVVLEAMHEEVLAGRVSIESAREERFRRLVVEATGKPAPDGSAVKLARHYRRDYENSWRPVAGATELLTDLRARGLAIAIVTNNITAEQEMKLRFCGLDALVDALVTSEDAGAAKPAAKIFQAALDRIGSAATDVVMVGDAWHTDIAGALGAGIRPVWFNWRKVPSPDSMVVEVSALEPTADVARVILRP